jgi:hypothetical protein
MKYAAFFTAVIALTCSLCSPAHSESPQSDSTIEALNWLVGHWEGEGFGGVCEEIWHEAAGGAMMGSFRLVVDNKVRFYEIMTVTIDSAGPVLRIKHFNPDLTGWEEKDEVMAFPHLSQTTTSITFDGLGYELLPDSTLRITIQLKADRQVVMDCRKKS